MAGDVAPDGGGVSFWAERMADACPPFIYGKIEIPPPGDVGAAELDDCQTVTDEAYALLGDGPAERLMDEVDERGDMLSLVVDDLLHHFALLRAPSIGWFLLVERINCYGEAIEYDLDAGGFRWGLHDYFAGRVPGGWDHLLRMVNRLPLGSQFRSAIADDDELAARILAVEGPLHKRKKGSGRPPLAGFTLEVSYLHRIANQLTRLEWAEFASQAGKKRTSPPKGQKGPETADERVDFADFMREHDEVVSQVLVRKGGSNRDKNVSENVLGRDNATVERPAPGEATRKGTVLPRAVSADDDEDAKRPAPSLNAIGDKHDDEGDGDG